MFLTLNLINISNNVLITSLNLSELQNNRIKAIMLIIAFTITMMMIYLLKVQQIGERTYAKSNFFVRYVKEKFLSVTLYKTFFNITTSFAHTSSVHLLTSGSDLKGGSVAGSSDALEDCSRNGEFVKLIMLAICFAIYAYFDTFFHKFTMNDYSFYGYSLIHVIVDRIHVDLEERYILFEKRNFRSSLILILIICVFFVAKAVFHVNFWFRRLLSGWNYE